MKKLNVKKYKKYIIIAILFIAIIVTVLLCSNNNNNKRISGKYKIVEIVNDGKDISEQIKQMEENGMHFILELNDNRTGTINMFGEKSEISYDDKVININGDSQTYIIDKDNRLILKNEKTKMVFEKISDIEFKKIEESISEQENDLENSINNEESNSIVGKYKILEMIKNGQNMEKEIEQMESLGYMITLELNEDKTGKMDIFGEIIEFTYDENSIILDDEKQAYTVNKNGKITIEDSVEKTKMVFAKVIDEEE